MPKKYYIETFGCQMNVHDSEKMAGILTGQGCIEVSSPREADIILFNTCSIREKAEQKFFSRLGRMRRLKEKRPDLKIGVAGCIAQLHGGAVFSRMPYVDFVVGPQNLHQLPELVDAGTSCVACHENDAIADIDLPVVRKDPVKAWVTIMYGCNNFCSYCIVPYARGRERSRPADNIVAEISDLADKGIKEVTLLGQNVNSYRNGCDFPSLLSKINAIEGIERIRFVTSHPKDLSDALVTAMCELPKVCEHLHLPLQSGSSRILSLMNRKYTFEEYAGKIKLLRNALPGIAITTDIIAGFPQEEDADHACTVKALKEICFDGIFAFNYSPRSGTAAAQMEDSVPNDIKAQRLNEILEVQNNVTDYKNKLLEGELCDVLIEAPSGEASEAISRGRTRTNKIVLITDSEVCLPGSTVLAKIVEARRHSLSGVRAG